MSAPIQQQAHLCCTDCQQGTGYEDACEPGHCDTCDGYARVIARARRDALLYAAQVAVDLAQRTIAARAGMGPEIVELGKVRAESLGELAAVLRALAGAP